MNHPQHEPTLVQELANALRDTLAAALGATGCNLYGEPEDYQWWRTATAALTRLEREQKPDPA